MDPKLSILKNSIDLEVENRLGAEVLVRIERRGPKLVVVLEPGKTPAGLFLPAVRNGV